MSRAEAMCIHLSAARSAARGAEAGAAPPPNKKSIAFRARFVASTGFNIRAHLAATNGTRALVPIGCARSRHVLVSILLYAHLVRLAASARPMPRLECGPSRAPALDQDLTAQTSVWFKRRIVAGEWDGYFFAVAESPSSSTAGAGRAGMRRAGAEAPAWVFSACAALHDVQRTAPRLERGAVRVAGVTCLAWCPVPRWCRVARFGRLCRRADTVSMTSQMTRGAFLCAVCLVSLGRCPRPWASAARLVP